MPSSSPFLLFCTICIYRIILVLTGFILNLPLKRKLKFTEPYNAEEPPASQNWLCFRFFQLQIIQYHKYNSKNYFSKILAIKLTQSSLALRFTISEVQIGSESEISILFLLLLFLRHIWSFSTNMNQYHQRQGKINI